VPNWINIRGSRLLSVPTIVIGMALAACGGNSDEASDLVLATAGTPAVATPSVTPTPDVIEAVVWPSLGTARVTTENLNVRAGPGLGFPVLGRLQPNDEIPVSGRGAWGLKGSAGS